MNWQELEFRHLKYAIAVADKQSFMRAAEDLNIDQPFLSRQIKVLEKRLGFKLFGRNKRPLQLTTAGKELLREARQILTHTEQAIEFAQRASQGHTGKLSIGINTSIANSKLPDILQSFKGKFPDVTLVLSELASYNQLEKLSKQEIDVGFLHAHNLDNFSSKSDGNLATKTVLRELLVLVLPIDHRFGKHTDISLAMLAQEEFILPPYSLLPGLREQIEKLCEQAGFKPRVKQEAAWISTVLSLVAGKVGISLLPANVKHLQRTGVVYVDIKGKSPILEIVAVYLQNNESPTLENFLKVVENLP